MTPPVRADEEIDLNLDLAETIRLYEDAAWDRDEKPKPC
jgi:hypothetical protein